ncbi:hypothetical protein TcG_10787, partial [Trypanosoma cruzi]
KYLCPLSRYLALPCRLPWCLSDDILDPSLPPRGRLGSECRLSADTTLQSYVPYLPRVFPWVRVIDLDANNAIVFSDAVLLHRCCCRCGVFISPDGSEMRFVSHLYAALTPTVGAESVQRNDGRLAATVSHRKGGPFAVQLGGDGCGSLLLLVYGGCSVVMCACFLCGCRFALLAVCELCLPREVAPLPRTQRRRCDGVCVSLCCTSFSFRFALPFSTRCVDLLTEFSNSTAAAARPWMRRKMAMVVWCVWEQGFRWVLASIWRERLDCVSYW